MEREVKRYRIRPKTYLCLYPEETMSEGISTGEETLEELVLKASPGFGYSMYAALRDLPEEELGKISVSERNEKLFQGRREASGYIKAHPADNLFLYGVREVRTLDRSLVSRPEFHGSPDGISEELKSFERKA